MASKVKPSTAGTPGKTASWNALLRRCSLPLILLLTACLGLVGIGWGLPSAQRKALVLPEATPQLVADIARAGSTIDRGGPGADVQSSEREMQRAAFRVILHTYHPDEFLTLKALRGLPRLAPDVYRYGGPFLVGAALFIQSGRALGLVHVVADPAYYLERPQELARFYLAIRLFVVTMTLLLVYSAWRFGRLAGGNAAGLLTAALVAVLPITVNGMHEGKPHLPACAFVFLAAEASLRWYREEGRRWRGLILAGIWCGLAAGMALSFAAALLLPLTAVLMRLRPWRELRATVARLAMLSLCFLAVLLLTNPWYLTHHAAVIEEARQIAADVVQRYGGGLAADSPSCLQRAAGFFTHLLPLAMSWPLVLLGGLAGLWALWRDRETRLFAPAWLMATLLAAINVGASLDPNAARFALLPAMLLIPALAVAVRRIAASRRFAFIALSAAVLAPPCSASFPYLAAYRADSRPDNSHVRAAAGLSQILGLNRPQPLTLSTLLTPSAYSLPPIPIQRCRVLTMPEMGAPDAEQLPDYLLLDNNAQMRRPGGWWNGNYQVMARLPSLVRDDSKPWHAAPMAMADLDFVLLKRLPTGTQEPRP